MQIQFARLVALLVLLTVFTTSAASQEKKPSAQDDFALLQGVWEASVAVRDPDPKTVVRMVKEIKADSETVTGYNSRGEVLTSQRNSFELRDSGAVRLFVFYNLRITEGPRKGLKQEQRSAYVYRINGDEYYEIWGIITNSPPTARPRLTVWKRVKPDVDLPELRD